MRNSEWVAGWVEWSGDWRCLCLDRIKNLQITWGSSSAEPSLSQWWWGGQWAVVHWGRGWSGVGWLEMKMGRWIIVHCESRKCNYYVSDSSSNTQSTVIIIVIRARNKWIGLTDRWGTCRRRRRRNQFVWGLFICRLAFCVVFTVIAQYIYNNNFILHTFCWYNSGWDSGKRSVECIILNR